MPLLQCKYMFTHKHQNILSLIGDFSCVSCCNVANINYLLGKLQICGFFFTNTAKKKILKS